MANLLVFPNFRLKIWKFRCESYFATGLILKWSEAAKKVASLGSGVGLYLAGQIIKAHKGRVWAESPARAPRAGGGGEGKGSAFFVELPQ